MASQAPEKGGFRRMFQRVDPHQEYGGIEPQSPDSMAVVAEILPRLTRNLMIGRRRLVTLLTQEFPATTTIGTTGKLVVPASGTALFDCSVIPSRIVAIELFNFDAANEIVLITNTPHGGIIAGNINNAPATGKGITVRPGGYWSTDISLDPNSTQITLDNTANSGTTAVQLNVHGL